VDLIGSFGRRQAKHNFGMKMIWSLRPRGTSAKNWSPDLIGAAVIQLEWIARGLLLMSFWTALRHSIAALEGW